MPYQCSQNIIDRLGQVCDIEVLFWSVELKTAFLDKKVYIATISVTVLLSAK